MSLPHAGAAGAEPDGPTADGRLQSLARAADQARDRVGAVRAYRRIAALARDSAEAATAHVHLARLCAESATRWRCFVWFRLSTYSPA